MFGKCLANKNKKNRKQLKINYLRFIKVLKAGLEPARALLPTGF